MLTNASETVLESYNYTAFGTIQGTPTVLTPFLWGGLVGYYWDAELATQYIRARHYQPHIARWISLDPIGFEGGDANLFRYVGNSPTSGWLTDSNVDPSGLQPSTRPPQPKWTCKTAKEKIEELRNQWNALGYKYSVQLIDAFLSRNTGDREIIISMCSELISDRKFRGFLYSRCYKKNWVPNPLRDPGSKYPWVDYEFLPLWDLAFDALDGQWDSLGDLAYAIGTAHVSGVVKCRERPCTEASACTIYQMSASITITDRFAFHADPTRERNSFYSAGVFLTKKCRYKSVNWKTTCTLIFNHPICDLNPGGGGPIVGG
ncbi:MAG: RHS repeat-associated core domain-containing protein [Planctomycetaceae bacterium]